MREDERIAIERDRDRLSQESSRENLLRARSPGEMVVVYLNDWAEKKTHIHGVYCALIPSCKCEQVLLDSKWDLRDGDGQPGTVEYYENEASRVEYLRFGREDGIEPLVIVRSFHGIRDDYLEICEEFRLFHNLFQKKNEYIKIDDSGGEQLVAVVEPNRVKIRLKEIRQFLALKEMRLSIQFDYKEFSTYALEELGVAEDENEGRGKLCCWRFSLGPSIGNGGLAFSRLCGKVLVPPFQKSKSGFWGFEERKKKYEEFIIGIDDNGDEIVHTCNPDTLANYFGANPGAPNYLTSVSFRKTVLDKYYQHPGKFKVTSGYLGCGYLWGVPIDNDHDDKVVVWLGDLGCLPHQEQLHWKAHNFASPTGVSEIYFRQQICNQFANSNRPEHVFQRRYMDLQEACRGSLGWQLIRPLTPGDEYHLETIRVPATDEQPEFDQLAQSLAKILIDSLNSGRLKSFIPEEERGALRGKGSISYLEAALAARGASDASSHIAFLRRLQSLRSTASAHRKGDNYEAALKQLNPDGDDLKTVFAGILAKCIGFLDCFIVLVERGAFQESE